MRNLIFILLAPALFSCQTDKNPASALQEQVILYTNKPFYSQKETIHFTLKNLSDLQIEIGTTGKKKYFLTNTKN